MDFNWNHFAFNSFESALIWFSFQTLKKSFDKKLFQLKSVYFQFIWKKSTDKKGFQFKSLYFQFIWIYFQLIFLLNLKEIRW
jgi:hypothetical protein